MNVELLLSLLQQRCILDQSLLNRWTLIYNSQYSQSRERLYCVCIFFLLRAEYLSKLCFYILNLIYSYVKQTVNMAGTK